MLLFKNTFFALCFLMVAQIAIAQKPKPKPVKATVQKFKPPKLTTTFGAHSDSVITLSVDEALQVVSLPLTITDAKKNAYTISSYQCMYKRIAVTEDETSGKVTPVSSIVADVFKATPLPEIWKRIITEQLKAGEEIYFFDIVVKDAQKRLMFAPNVKLIIQ